jgi:hypothetical protein
MVRPLIDFLPADYEGDSNPLNGSYNNDEFRNNYNPGAAGSAGANAFFASYQTMIVAQAKLAQANGATLFCIGTELDQITGPAYKTYWTDMISAVRAVFTGKLTYSALWDDNQSYWRYQGTGLVAGTGDITTQISFWKQLDYVGIDEYAPISDLKNPTVSQLVAGWTAAPTDALAATVTGGESLIGYYEGISATLGMPLIFTELGYGNSSDAAISPATPGYGQDGSADGATADPTLQSNLYKAFFQAWQQDGNGSLAGVYLWNWEPNGTGASAADDFTVQGLAAQQSVKGGFTACYAAGTRILTPNGEVAVEALHPGQLVSIAGGDAKPVRWIGHRRVDCLGYPRPEEVWPVRVRPHAFGPGRPHRDLWLSPDHAVLAGDELIPIRYLVNGASVCQESRNRITYYHVELAAHEVLLAEGLPAESYLDTGNRSAFVNGGTAVMATPDFARRVWATSGCAPLVTDGSRLIAARQALRQRAETLGHVSTTEAALRLIADGRPLAAVCRGSSRWVELAAGVRTIALVSRSFVPAHMDPAGDDHRVLGVAVQGLSLDGEVLAPDDARWGAGWHAAEQDWRWTNGAAVLAVFGARTLVFDVVMTGHYWQDTQREHRDERLRTQ